MEKEVVRAIQAGLADATIGINVQIDALVLDQVGDQRPSHVSLANYFDDDWVAKKVLHLDEARNANIVLPVVAVYLDQPPTYDANPADGEGVYRDGDFPVAVSWFSISADETLKRQQASDINRALLRFFTRFNANAAADTFRLRNGVHLYAVKGQITQYTPNEPWGELTLAAQTNILYRVREQSA